MPLTLQLSTNVREEILINASPDKVREALRDFRAVHCRFVPGFVVDLRMDGEKRIVTLLWITDVLPDEFAEPIGRLRRRGAHVIKETPEGRASPTA